MDDARHVNCSYRAVLIWLLLVSEIHSVSIFLSILQDDCLISVMCSRPCDFWPLRISNFLIAELTSYLLTYSLTHSLTHSLTPWCRVLLEKLTSFHLIKKFPAFCGTRRYITTFMSACHLPLSWAGSIQSIPPHPTSWRSEHSIEIGLWWNTHEFS